MVRCRRFAETGTLCRIGVLAAMLCLGAAFSSQSTSTQICLTCRCVDATLTAIAQVGSDEAADSAAIGDGPASCVWPRLETRSGGHPVAGLPAALRKALLREAESLKQNWPAIHAAWKAELQTMKAACGYRFDSGALAGLPDLVRRCVEDQALTRLLERAWRARLKASAEIDRASHSRTAMANPCLTAWGACVTAMNLQRVDNAAALMERMNATDIARALKKEPRLAGSIFLITQHADSLPAFQKDMLDRLARLSKRGLLPARDIAMLTDRVMARSQGKQHFGTQMSCAAGKVVYRPPLDATRQEVDRRRQEVGLPPLAQMERMMAERFCARHQP